MIENLCETVYKMYSDYSRDRYTAKKPQLVMLCSPECYCRIRGELSDKIRYERNSKNYNIPILYIIGIKVPVVIRGDMPKNVEFTIMYRENYERQEQEELFKKFMDMWE